MIFIEPNKLQFARLLPPIYERTYLCEKFVMRGGERTQCQTFLVFYTLLREASKFFRVHEERVERRTSNRFVQFNFFVTYVTDRQRPRKKSKYGIFLPMI